MFLLEVLERLYGWGKGEEVRPSVGKGGKDVRRIRVESVGIVGTVRETSGQESGSGW